MFFQKMQKTHEVFEKNAKYSKNSRVFCKKRKKREFFSKTAKNSRVFFKKWKNVDVFSKNAKNSRVFCKNTKNTEFFSKNAKNSRVFCKKRKNHEFFSKTSKNSRVFFKKLKKVKKLTRFLQKTQNHQKTHEFFAKMQKTPKKKGEHKKGGGCTQTPCFDTFLGPDRAWRHFRASFWFFGFPTLNFFAFRISPFQSLTPPLCGPQLLMRIDKIWSKFPQS